MTDPNHLAILHQGATIWNEWRSNNPDVNPDLTGVNLNRFDFSYYNLARVNFDNANLTQARFHYAPLSEATFNGTNLAGVDLSRKNLAYTSLVRVNLRGAILSESSLYRSDLSYACLEGVDLSDANLPGTNLSEASLKEASLSRAQLAGANLYRADLSHANLTEADLTGANLTEANLDNANLTSAIFYENQYESFAPDSRDEDLNFLRENNSSVDSEISSGSLNSIEELSKAQKDELLKYKRKWKKVTISIDKLNHENIVKLINSLYTMIEEEPPEVTFCSSPYAAVKQIGDQLLYPLASKRIVPLFSGIREQINKQVSDDIVNHISDQVSDQLSIQINDKIIFELNRRLDNISENKLFGTVYRGFHPERWINDASLIDFCLTVLKCKYEVETWNLFSQIIKDCTWLFPYRGKCFVCERPVKLLLNTRGKLKKGSEPIIQFSDAFNVYYG
jgi:uncharacterized protein YjbI with pentapeptide repeats